ncbi:RHS repeat domain-containing protein [Brumimicrobium sp.]|uniref:RHS repeat domain-containing protein n=1 Tax=Brumimicrobium sp. TaxID=2029867 RepID=UPI003A935C90
MGLDQTQYGSSRIGQEQRGEIIASSDLNLVNINTATQNIIGNKYFEMSNHLGNVLEVVSDRKLPVNDGNGNIDYFLADVVSYSDYYPYCMQMPGRNGSTGDYRYGFQGQEKDDEVKGEGNSINYKYRMHDPRIGRFFAVDPLADKFPHMTPYQFAGNKPIWSREIEGLESEVDAEAVELEMGEDFTLDESQMPADKDFDYEAGGNLYQKAVNESGLDPLQFSQLYDITFNKGVPNASLTEKGKEILGNNSQNAINGFANISRTFNRLAINASAEEAYQFNDHIMSQNISATGDLRGFYNSLVPYMNRSRMAHAGNLGLAVTALGSALTGNPVMGGYGGFNVSQRTSFNFSRFNFSNNMRSIGPSPNFIVSPNGTAFPVPNNSIGPFPALNNRGIQFVNGNSGFGLSSRVHGFRFMDPITSGKYLYPNGYGNYFNSSNQSIHPYSGNMLSRSSDWWHIH